MCSVGSVMLDPELAAIFQQPIKKQYGVVEFIEKPAKHNVRHEVLKIYMRRNYPTSTMRADLKDCLTSSLIACNPPYFHHPKVNQKRNIRKAQRYLKHLSSQRGFFSYDNRTKMNNGYRDVIERMRYSLKTYIEELTTMYQKADHIHFLHEILFIKNLQTYPFPRRWIVLIAFYHGMPEYERLIAAIRVLTEYDGDRAPEFHAEYY